MAASRRRRKRRRKSAKRRIFDRFLILLAFFVSVAAFTTLIVLYWNRDTGIGDEQLELCLVGNTMNISWEDTEAVDFIRLYRVDKDTDRTVVIGEYKDNSAVIEGVTSGEELNLKFEPVRIRRFGSYEFETKSRRKSVTIYPTELTVPNLSDEVNAEDKTVKVSWQMDDGCVCELYNVNGFDGQEELLSSEDYSTVLTVGDEEADLEMPLRDEPIKIIARTYKQEANCKQYSVYGDVLEINRVELLPDSVSIATGINLGGNYSFTWQEAKPDTYEFMQYDEETDRWETLKTCGADDDLSYAVDWLPSEKSVYYKILAYFKNPKDESEEGYIESPVLQIRTNRSPLYCTIWPVMDLDVYADADSDETVGKVKGGETLCVMDDKNGRFKVRTDSGYGYIDENYVLIDLPEYLGDLCKYDITNSYSSIFKTQDYPIPGLTGTVIPGFEDICLSKDEGEFVVPYLYPCAEKLAIAAEAASTDDYIFRIYEAYRPHEATRYMYDTTEALLAAQVPILDEEGNEASIPVKVDEQNDNSEENAEYNAYMEQLNSAIAAQATAEGFDITTDVGMLRMAQLYPTIKLQIQAQRILLEQGIDPASAPGGVLLADMISKQPTYESAMTNGGSLKLSAFLAKTISAHNRGIALDMTLQKRAGEGEAENGEDGEIVEMQSPMHDLSFRSITSKNNENAELLKKYMTEAGFNGLSSEWWHFQDDETRNKLNLGVYLENGVSLEGWKNNNVGWRYQLNNGDYYRNTTEVIDGVSYTFNERGYCENFE